MGKVERHRHREGAWSLGQSWQAVRGGPRKKRDTEESGGGLGDDITVGKQANTRADREALTA